MDPPLIGNSESINRIRELINYVADTNLNIIITGKSGVGKEVVASHLVHGSQRKDKPFIKVDCALLPGGLLESELFGFERGSFTCAYRKKRGKFELAHQGVIFLDEIGDMSLSLQSKLLHVLQSGEFTPLGSEKDVRSDVWVIAATNQDLEKKVKEGLFRKDLYYRLNTIRIHVPPLRKRPEDIPPLINYYIEKYTSQFDGKKISKPDSDALGKLLEYSWPGNVRELQNIIKSSLVMRSWKEVVGNLTIKDKPDVNPTSDQKGLYETLNVDHIIDLINNNSQEHGSISLKNITKEVTDRVDKEVISSVLDITDWNRAKASKILDVSYRTLLYKISDLEIKQRRTL